MAAHTQKINKFLTDNVGRSEKLALLLDYDGTLAPISPHPDLAILPLETRELLNKISNCKDIFCSFISGRQADNVKKLVGIPSFTYAGSHGFEIIYPDGTRYVHTVPKEDLDTMKNMEEELKQRVTRNGAWVENKGKVITFHFRETPEEFRPALIKEAEEIIRSHGLHPSDALCAIEVQPKVSWNKGYAGEYILKNKFGEDWNTKVKAIFIGDDISDEKLMELCKGRVLTFRVSPLKNVKTASDFQLMSLPEVVTVLRWVESQYC